MNVMDPNMNNNQPVLNNPVPQQPVVPQAVVEPVQPVAPPVVDTAIQGEAEVTAEAIREQLQQTLDQPAPNAIPQAVVAAPVEPAVVTPVESTSQSTSPQSGISPQAQPSAQPVETVPSVATTPVTIYTIDTCPFCKAEKEYLQSKNIAFTEKKVDSDEAALKEMLALSDNFAGVPVSVLTTDKEKRVVKGFTQADFEEELRTVGLLLEAAPTPVVAAQPTPVVPTAPVAEAPVAPVAVPDFPQTPQQ